MRTDHYKHKSGAHRARWLAELDGALREARRLVAELSRQSLARPSFVTETAAVARRLEQAIGQVDALRRGQVFSIRELIAPKWLDDAPDPPNHWPRKPR